MAEMGVGDQQLHFQRLGGGDKTVVLSHGLVVDNLSGFFFTLANPLARQSDVILYDLRGHGLSGKPAQGYRLEDFAGDLVGMLDGLGATQPVYLLGNSFGGVLSLYMAARHRQRVAGVILVDGHFPLHGWGEEMAETLALEGEERDAKIAELYEDWHARKISRKRRRLIKSARFLVYESSLLADLRASPCLDAEELAAIDLPVLGLYGENSELAPRATQLAELMPRFDLRFMPSCSHQVMFEAPDAVRQSVCEWLEGQSA